MDEPGGWRARAIHLDMSAFDLDLLDAVLCIRPELRIVLFLAQEARGRQLAYPVENVDSLTTALGADTFELSGHRIDARTLTGAMPAEWFPLTNEGELLAAIHLGIVKCDAEASVRWVEELQRNESAS